MNYGQLLNHCIYCLDSYRHKQQSVEEHLNEFIKAQKVHEEDDQTFITEVFSGCVRYKPVMSVVLEGYYAKDGRKTLCSEQNMYSVLCYLTLFRLDELGITHFRSFVKSQDINKMYKFLNFFLDDRNLLSWITAQWEKNYEHSFVQTTLLSPILKWLPELKDMLLQMKCKIDNKVPPKRKVLSTTETKPFNITQPRARSIPLPDPIPKLKPHKPPPYTLYQEPSEFSKINKRKEINRRLAEEQLMEASRFQFACANSEKSSRAKELLNNIIAEEEAKLDFDKHKANPPPSFLNQDVPVKMNTAAILREGRLYQKREAEEIRKWESLEAGAKDKSEFMQWQTGMRQRDLDAKLAEIERRRLEGKLSHEEAILSRQNLIHDNKLKVQEMKEETEKMMKEYLEQKFRQEQEIRQLVENTMQGHKNTKNAKKKLQEYKQSIVQAVNEESRDLMQKALEEAEADLRRKMELIHQIRALEAVPLIRQKFVDFTKTSGAGLLSEMSIAELRERLSLMKTAQKEEEELKRDDILAGKQAKDQKLLDTLETISKHRLEQTKSAAVLLETRKKNITKKPEVKDESLIELQKKLEEKRAQRFKEQENSRITANSLSSTRTKNLINQKKALEENRWRELEQTRERATKLIAFGPTHSQSATRLAKSSTLAT
ncbi:hypothetical protein ScPMuIL_001262 [Solemya velum]